MSIVFGYNPVQKPNHARGKRKRGNVTRITQKVRDECNRRSMEVWNINVPCCERCSKLNYTAAHMQPAGQMGPGDVPWNVVNLCGTHGTKECHDWADNTEQGRAWREKKAKELYEYYHKGQGRFYWKTNTKG